MAVWSESVTAAERTWGGAGHIRVAQSVCPALWAATSPLPSRPDAPTDAHDRLLPAGSTISGEANGDQTYALPSGQTFSMNKCAGTYVGGTVSAGPAGLVGAAAVVGLVFYYLFTATGKR